MNKMIHKINNKYLVLTAVGLVLVQHTLQLAVANFSWSDMPQTIWLALNAAEAAVLLQAWRLLRGEHPQISAAIGGIAVILLGAMILENFIVPLGRLFWLGNSTLLMAGLILSAIYLARGEIHGDSGQAGKTRG